MWNEETTFQYSQLSSDFLQSEDVGYINSALVIMNKD